MDTIVARQTVEEIPVPVETKEREYITPELAKDMPLEVYEQETHTKYIDKLFEVDNILPEGIRESIRGIDEYVTGLMRDRGYKPTTDAYRDTFNSFLRELGIDKHTSLESTLERVSKYIEAERMLKSLKDVDEEKILRQLKKSPTKSIIGLIMRQVEKHGL